MFITERNIDDFLLPDMEIINEFMEEDEDDLVQRIVSADI